MSEINADHDQGVDELEPDGLVPGLTQEQVKRLYFSPVGHPEGGASHGVAFSQIQVAVLKILFLGQVNLTPHLTTAGHQIKIISKRTGVIKLTGGRQ